MRLPDSAHASRPWRIHEIAPDFKLEDVWELPGRGGPGDFPRLVDLITSFDPARGPSRISRALWDIRWRVGRLLGWDDPDGGLNTRVATLLDRLPADLLGRGRGPDFTALPFVPLYLSNDEFAAEMANKTMHGVLHIGAIEDEAGSFRARMAVLVKSNGRFGNAYMAAIRPFRYLLVYPALMRQGRELWEGSSGAGHDGEGSRGGLEGLDAYQAAEHSMSAGCAERITVRPLAGRERPR
jgi:hypothetical protein